MQRAMDVKRIATSCQFRPRLLIYLNHIVVEEIEEALEEGKHLEKEMKEKLNEEE